MVKKNRVRVYGKTFHLTPAGKILPLGKKQNAFTRCVSEELVKNEHLMLSLERNPDMLTKKGRFTEEMKQTNKDLFKMAVYDCQHELWKGKYPKTAKERLKAEAPKAKIPAK